LRQFRSGFVLSGGFFRLYGCENDSGGALDNFKTLG
jgi:hypothetical protein